MKLHEIHIRDPFILVWENRYYMYGTRGSEAWHSKGTGLDVHVSPDLKNWDGPHVVFTPPAGFWADRDFWAPEVHEYNGAFYMFVSFKSEHQHRGTQILIADTPMGPFRVHSDGPVTPRDWECLDGTLYIDKNNKPYMVFCHEWTQIQDGEICALPLSDDLSRACGEPFLLFKASEPVWATGLDGNYITDGPFLYDSNDDGRLCMIWSSFCAGNYVQAVAFSESDNICGPWKHLGEPIFDRDGGHGMLFKTLDGKRKLILHSPNETPGERPKIIEGISI